MFPFNKKNIPSANIQLNLGKSPTQYSISISPPKPRNTNKPFTSHDINKAIDEHYNNLYLKQSHSNIPNPSLMTEIKLFTNKLKKTLENKLFTKKQKPVFLDLGKSSSSHNNLKKSIGGNKPTNKPTEKKFNKKFNKPTKKSTKKNK